ncbi:hypothetical protein psyc5s11_44730 [Clostridium gelidum]|uniref:HTH cro/C1-type domain-containing protein n=1 Tax=Clostridium gelidum TaxID=704125 RepID=A0ABM7T8V2_9CLOT|nr:helix-turn-helix domain-containing protein [Clostridium gelidum]BCZ48406.1 hypothetical protein psyc5s11_44730 [Clostridium gelidum]
MRIDLTNEFRELPANTIAENLVRLRKLNNLTQQYLATALGISKSNISKYERGKLFPTKEMSMRLADFFNINNKYFYDNYFEAMDNFQQYISDLLKPDIYISKNQLCKLLGISKRTLYRYCYHNDLPSRTIFIKIQKHFNKD